MNFLLLTTSVALVVGASVANAGELTGGACQALVQQGTCSYATALKDGEGERIGKLSQVEGRVMASDKSGFTPAKADIPLMPGDRVLVLEGGKAVLVAGPSYSQVLASPAMIDASVVGGCGCLTVQSDVRLFGQEQAAAAAAATAGTGGGLAAGTVGIAAALGLAGVAAAAAAIAISDGDDDAPMSP